MAENAVAAVVVMSVLLSGCGKNPKPSDKAAATAVSSIGNQAPPAPAWGAQPSDADVRTQFSAVYHACVDRSEGVTVKLRECYSDEYNRLDDALNATYAKLLAKLKRDAQQGEEEDRTPELQAAERAWIAWRDAQCTYETSWETGTEGPLMVENCFMISTWRRNQALQEELAQPSL